MEPVTAVTLKAFLQRLRERLIEFRELERHFKAILPQAPEADIVPREFQAYFAEVRRRIESP